MQIDILTLFPAMFSGPFGESIVKRAQDKGLVKINVHNIRDWAIDERGTVDDRPYGGGVGMILRVEPIYYALTEIKRQSPNSKIILTDARGIKFTQIKAKEYSQLDQLILIAGHYEGVDERIREHLADEAVSIGEYILTGGEIPVMALVDAVTRLIPGVLQKPEAVEIESFSRPDSKSEETNRDLEFPQYTRPEVFNNWKVPEVLLSGNHEKIRKWREENRPNN